MKTTAEEMLTSGSLLASYIFNHFTAARLDNAGGSAYREGCIANYKDGILFLADNRRDGVIHIAPNPNTKLVRGCQDPRCNGNSYPGLADKVSWIPVWSNGVWRKRGPWESKIEARLKEIVIHVDSILLKKKREKEKQADLAKTKKREAEQELLKNWGTK